MIDGKELEYYLQQISKTKLTEENYKEFFDYSVKVCKDYDKDLNLKSEIRMKELHYIYAFYHKYCNMLYGQKVKAIIEPNDNAENAYYWREKRIKYNFSDFELKQNSTYIIFNIFHENQHAIQHTQENVGNIMNMDPMKLLFLKEIMFIPTELYKKNHNTMLIENDANLVAYSYLLPIIKEYFPENLATLNQRIQFEHENVATKLYSGFIDSNDIHKNKIDDSTLPVLYELDKQFKEHKGAVITPKMLDEIPIYKYIIDEEGKLKKYSRIIEDKNKLLNSQLDIDNKKIFPISSANYGSKIERTPREQIELIYKIIINSDPALYIEDCIANNKFNELINEINKYPKIYELYKKDFHNIIPRYINLNNIQEFEKINEVINSEELKNIINRRYEHIIKSEIKNITGVFLSIEDENDNIKDINVLQQEYEYFNTMLDSKKLNKQIEEDKYQTLKKYLGKIYNKHGVYIKNNDNYIEQVEKYLNIKIDGVKGYNQELIDGKEIFNAFPKNEQELINEQKNIAFKIQSLEDDGIINTTEKQKMLKAIEIKYEELIAFSKNYYAKESYSSMLDELEQNQLQNSNNSGDEVEPVDLISDFQSEFMEFYINKYKMKEVYDNREEYSYDDQDDEMKDKIDIEIFRVISESLIEDEEYNERKSKIEERIKELLMKNEIDYSSTWRDFIDNIDKMIKIDNIEGKKVR